MPDSLGMWHLQQTRSAWQIVFILFNLNYIREKNKVLICKRILSYFFLPEI